MAALRKSKLLNLSQATMLLDNHFGRLFVLSCLLVTTPHDDHCIPNHVIPEAHLIKQRYKEHLRGHPQVTPSQAYNQIVFPAIAGDQVLSNYVGSNVLYYHTFTCIT